MLDGRVCSRDDQLERSPGSAGGETAAGSRVGEGRRGAGGYDSSVTRRPEGRLAQGPSSDFAGRRRHSAPRPVRGAGDFLRSVRLAAASNLLIHVVGSGTGLALAYVLAPTGRGEYAAVMAWTGSFALLGALGLTTSICFFVASDAERAPQYFETAKRLLLALGVASGVIGLLITPWLDGGRESLRNAYLVGFAALPLVFLNGSWVFGLQASDLRSWARVRMVYPLAYAAALVVLYVVEQLTVITALLAIAGAGIVQGVVARRSWRRIHPELGEFVRAHTGPLVRYGWPNVVATMPHLVNTRLDQVALSLLVPLSDLGTYAVAVSLSLLAFPITSAFGNVALPRIARQRQNRPDDARATVRAAVFGTAVAGTVIASGVAAAVGPLISLAPTYSGVPRLTYVLIPGAVMLGLNQVLSDILRGYDQALLVARAEGAAALVTVALFVALVPSLGVMGAAISSTASYTTAFALLLLAAARLR